MEIRKEVRQNRAGTRRHIHGHIHIHIHRGGLRVTRTGTDGGGTELREKAFGELSPTVGVPRGR